MPQLHLKPGHKAVRDYYATLQQYDKHDITHEGAVSVPFEMLLTVCAKQVDATLDTTVRYARAIGQPYRPRRCDTR